MEKDNKQPVYKKEAVKPGITILIISVVVLFLALSGLIYLYFSQKADMVEMETVLTAEKDFAYKRITRYDYWL